MSRNGYIKLNRKMLDWGWYQDYKTKAVFLHLLLVASYEESEFMGIKIKPGQAVIGRRSLARELGMTEREVRTALKHLETSHEVTLKTSQCFTIATIENWAKYQGNTRKNVPRNVPRSDQQTTTLKNIKNYKEEARNTNKGVEPPNYRICAPDIVVENPCQMPDYMREKFRRE